MVFYVQRVVQTEHFVRVLFKAGPGILHYGMPHLKSYAIMHLYCCTCSSPLRVHSVRTGYVFCGTLVCRSNLIIISCICGIFFSSCLPAATVHELAGLLLRSHNTQQWRFWRYQLRWLWRYSQQCCWCLLYSVSTW